MKFSRKRNKKVYLAPEQKLIIKQVFFGIILFSFLALILWGVWHLTRLPSLTISEVIAEDGETIPAEKIRTIVHKKLEGEYWHFVPRQFAWFYPEKEIQNELKRVERIKNVSINRISGTELAVEFLEYLPDSLWCLEAEGRCLFVDSDAYAFGHAPYLTGESLLRYRTIGEEPKIGNTLMSENDFDNTKKFVWLLGQIGWFVSRIEVDQVDDVFYILNGGGELRVTLNSDPDEVFSYLEALILSDEFSHLKSDNFKYIDLRFGEKLYVNEELGSSEELAGGVESGEVIEIQGEMGEDSENN